MSYDALARRVEARLTQTDQIQAALRKDVAELVVLAAGLAAQNAKLTLELRLREPTMDEQEQLPATGGAFEGSEELREVQMIGGMWQQKYQEAVREVERVHLTMSSRESHARYQAERILALVAWLEELVGVAEGEEGCAECSGDGWDYRRCGEDTCEMEEPCEKCNRAGLRTSVAEYWAGAREGKK